MSVAETMAPATSGPFAKRPRRGDGPSFTREKMLRTLFTATILAGALAGSARAQAPDARYALPSDPKGALSSDGKQVARGINSVQAIKGTGGWRDGHHGASLVGHCAMVNAAYPIGFIGLGTMERPWR